MKFRCTKLQRARPVAGGKLFRFFLVIVGVGLGLSVPDLPKNESPKQTAVVSPVSPGGGPISYSTELENFLHRFDAKPILSERAAMEAHAVGGVELSAFCVWLGRHQQLPVSFLKANSDLLGYIPPHSLDELLTAFAGNTEAGLQALDTELRNGIEIKAGPVAALLILEKLHDNPRLRDGVSVVWPADFDFKLFIGSSPFKSQTVESQAWLVARMPGVDPGGYISSRMSFEATSNLVRVFSQYREKDLGVLLIQLAKSGLSFAPKAGSDEVFATGNEISFSGFTDEAFLQFLTSGTAGDDSVLLAESVASARIRTFGDLQMALNEGLKIPALPLRRAFLAKAVKEVAGKDPALASAIINANDAAPEVDCMVRSLIPFITDPAAKQLWESKLAALTAAK